MTKAEKEDKIRQILFLAKLLTACGYGKIYFTCGFDKENENDLKKAE